MAMVTASPAAPPDSAPRATRVALLLSYVGFISLGLPDTILGAVWPALRADLSLPLDAAGGAVLLTTAGVVLSSAASGTLRARFGTAAVLIASTTLASVALALGAWAPRWQVLLAAAFIAGLGGGAIDASLNHLVARRHSARHMNWLHACWGVGASLTPTLVAALLASGHSWRAPYAILALVEALLVFAFVGTRRLWRDDDAGAAASVSAPASDGQARGPQVASVLLFFFYGGVEAGMGLWATTLLTTTRGATAATAGALVAVYWAALTVGRFVLGALANRIGPMRLLRLALRVGVGALAALAIPGTSLWFAGAALGMLGLALAPVYPLTMHDTPSRFGPTGARLVGYQVAACSLGVSIIPWLLGKLAVHATALAIPPILLVFAGIVVALEAGRRASVTCPSNPST